MYAYTPYEQQARQEIDAWKQARHRGISDSARRRLEPLRLMVDRVVPNRLLNVSTEAVLGFVEMLHDGARWTYSRKSILREAARQGVHVSSSGGLAEQDLEVLDPIARAHFSSNRSIAALQGAGCGFGGMALVALDLPALLLVSFRSVQQIGSCYGFDMDDPALAPVVLRVFDAGMGGSAAAKTQVLVDIHRVVPALGANWTYRTIAETSAVGLALEMVKQQTRHLPRQLAQHITKQKLMQALPVAGAAIGAGVNYRLLSNVTRAAYMVFREAYLERKYALRGAVLPGGSGFVAGDSIIATRSGTEPALLAS